MKRRKKGVSNVVGTVILIAIVFAAGLIVWAVINNTIKDNLGETGSCTSLMGKVSLNPDYTCFDSNTQSMVFSINLEDVEIDGILISLSKSGSTKSIEFIDEIGATDEEIKIYNYPTAGGELFATKLPGKNEGLTYVYNASANFASGVESIAIAPIIKRNKCGVMDSISNVPLCKYLGISLS